MPGNMKMTSAGAQRELYILGDRLRIARQDLERIKHQAADSAERAARLGLSEVEIAKALGVNRLTVRSWLGK